MTTYSFATLPAWATKVQKIADAVVSQSANDMLASIKIAPGITRGGSRQRGTIPRDLGALAASLQSSLYGGTAMSGATSFVFVAGQMEAGDVAQFAWGGNVAPYAKAVHYGARGVQGTFWIDVAANKWPQFVRGAVRKAKATIQ